MYEADPLFLMVPQEWFSIMMTNTVPVMDPVFGPPSPGLPLELGGLPLDPGTPLDPGGLPLAPLDPGFVPSVELVGDGSDPPHAMASERPMQGTAKNSVRFMRVEYPTSD